MSVILDRPSRACAERLLTVADVARLPSELSSGPVRYELDNGRLITTAPPGDPHGAVEAKAVTSLVTQGEQRGHGRTRCGEVGIILWRDPDRLVAADVAFVAKRSLPIRVSPEGYLETIPELIVEVRSKNDSQPEVGSKVHDYLKAGVVVVWIADPKTRTVTVYRKDQEPRVFTENEVLTIEDIIPGLRITVRDLFEL